MSEERARCKMKADRREVILWKVRIISTGNAISSEVLKIKETFMDGRAAVARPGADDWACVLLDGWAGAAGPRGWAHVWPQNLSAPLSLVNEMLCAVSLVCSG